MNNNYQLFVRLRNQFFFFDIGQEIIDFLRFLHKKLYLWSVSDFNITRSSYKIVCVIFLVWNSVCNLIYEEITWVSISFGPG